jgi:hypothetical protein
MDVRVGGTSLVCMRAPNEFGGQDLYNTWTYEVVAPNQRLVYLSHFADKDGNRLDPGAHGMPPGTPDEIRNENLFKALGSGQTELIVTEFDWPVGQMMEMSQAGLEQCLDKMAESLKQPSN